MPSTGALAKLALTRTYAFTAVHACLICMVDDCIKIERKREDGTVEKFSKPNDVVMLDEKISGKKRFERVKAIFPTITKYCENYCDKPKDEHVFFGYVNKSNDEKKKQKLKRID